jgi:pyrroloquinoline quinone (PQQ) biosynthesis protein C
MSETPRAEGTLRTSVEALFAREVERLTASPQFQALESGRATREACDAFLENLARAHLRSPQLLAFLHALAPPAAREDLRENLLEELGRGEPGERPHPDLLRDLLAGAGLADRLPAIEARADEDLRRLAAEPLLHGTLRDVGLAALAEIVAFEYMLSRVAGRLARALSAHRGLPAAALAWFTHHSEVDVRHAAQGLAALEAYVADHGLPEDEALAIVDLAVREDLFARRYFPARVAPDPAALAGAVPERGR